MPTKEHTTPPILWSDVFETGNADIDAQHRRLLTDSVRLQEMVETHAPWAEVLKSLDALVADCTKHFRYEEEVLQATDFPRAQFHVARHREIEAMLQDLHDIIVGLDGCNPELRELVAAFEARIIDIIVRHDLDYKSHLLNAVGR